MVKKIINYLMLIIILFLVIFSIKQSVNLERCRKELGQVRVELQSARSRTEDVRETVKRFNERTREICNESIFTISELKQQIQKLRKEYEDMEKYIDSLDDSNEHFHIDNGDSIKVKGD